MTKTICGKFVAAHSVNKTCHFSCTAGHKCTFKAGKTCTVKHTGCNAYHRIQHKRRYKIAYYLAKRLIAVGIDTKIIESNEEVCKSLSELLPEATIIHGDGTNQKLLLQEGLERVQGFAALTGLDEENILLSLFAKKVSGAKVVTKIDRTNFTSVLNDLEMDSISYPRFQTADAIVKYARSMNASLHTNVENLYKLQDGRVEALEFLINEEIPGITGTMLLNMKLKKNILICSIYRRGTVIIPGGQDMLQVGDSVVLVTTDAHLGDIREIIED